MSSIATPSALETLSPSSEYPLIRVSGSARERGLLYGSSARKRITNTLNAYSELFAAYAGLTWAEARRYGLRYKDVIGDFDGNLVDEIGGIADGAAVEFEDILLINVRTEVMYGVGELRAAAECTAFAALPAATSNAHTILGQNWDWHPAAFESCVILAIQQEDRPDVVTVVEAGLLAKMGMNSEGVGVTTNAMVTDADVGEPGIPYHVILRAIQNCDSAEKAVDMVRATNRASSANYLIADRSGLALDLETAPGGRERLFEVTPVDGVIAHANCFLTPNLPVNDQTVVRKPLGMIRQRTMDGVLSKNRGRISLELMQEELTDHTSHPNALCRHPLDQLNPVDRSATVASVVMDLDDKVFTVASGQPCSHGYRRFTADELWPA